MFNPFSFISIDISHSLVHYLTDISYNLIYFVSWGQILFQKYIHKPAYNVWTMLYPPVLSNVDYDVYKTKDNQSILISRHKTYCPVAQEYQFMDRIYKETNPSTELIQEPVPSKVRFLDLEFQFKLKSNQHHANEVEHSISLFSPNYNYYVVGNTICSNFIEYFIHTHHPELITSHELELPLQYTLTVVDHNINVVSLTEKEALVLTETDYKVVS